MPTTGGSAVTGGKKKKKAAGKKKAAAGKKKTGHKKGGTGPSLLQLKKEAKRLGIPLSKDGKKKTKAGLQRAIAYRK